jgi:hypothetical protein
MLSGSVASRLHLQAGYAAEPNGSRNEFSGFFVVCEVTGSSLRAGLRCAPHLVIGPMFPRCVGSMAPAVVGQGTAAITESDIGRR